MATLLRRFVYLVVDGKRPGTLDLRGIDMSRFFNPRSMGSEVMVDARLPRPTMTFYAPSSEICSGSMNFMLLGRDKVLAMDQTGRSTIYDAGLHAMCPAPTLSKPKHRPVSVRVGEKLFVFDSTGRMAGDEHYIEALSCERVVSSDGEWYNDWRCHSLPVPPYRAADIRSYAVINDSELWVSTEDEEGTYSFDIGRGCWAKQGDWTLPFSGLAEYVADFKLWFGLSSKDGNNLLCALDLGARLHSSPVPCNVWEDLCPPKEWIPSTCSIVHLGYGRFCIARFFRDTGGKIFVVFTAVEVLPNGTRGKLLQMVKHKSECYSLADNTLNQWVL